MKRETTNNDIAIALGILTGTVKRIESDISDIKGKMEKDYATKEWVQGRYELFRNAVLTIITMFGIAIATFFINLVIKK